MIVESYYVSHKKLIEIVEFEISEIESELLPYSELIKKCKNREPELIEKTTIASILHSFYTGIENIIVTIVKYYDNTIVSGKNWHKKVIIIFYELVEK